MYWKELGVGNTWKSRCWKELVEVRLDEREAGLLRNLWGQGRGDQHLCRVSAADPPREGGPGLRKVRKGFS